MQLREFKEKKIVILGFGTEGQATLRWLRKFYPKQLVGIADANGIEKISEAGRELIAADGNVTLHLGPNYLDQLINYQIIVRTPGINPRLYGIEKALEKGILMTSASRIFFDNSQGYKIAVTGSKGKSTTASLIHKILDHDGRKVHLVGNIGKAALDFLPDSPDDCFVVEVSSYQLEDFRSRPNIGVFVSFFPEHLDYHRSVENYFEAKTHLFQNMNESDTMIYNGNNKVIATFAHKVKAHKVDFFRPSHVDITNQIHDKNCAQIEISKSLKIEKKSVKLLGIHNLENIVCAATVALAMKVEPEVIKSALAEFQGLRHRLEWLGEFRKIHFYDDAISTTPESTIAALEALEGQVSTLLVGGLDRGYNFAELGRKIVSAGVENLIILPGSGEAIWAAVLDATKEIENSSSPKAFRVNDMKHAVEKAYQCTTPEKVCLLSTASPSHNMFKNFEEKGDKFAYYVKSFA